MIHTQLFAIVVSQLESQPQAGQVDMLKLATHSGPVVTGVLLLLILFSVASWAIIGYKLAQIRGAQKSSARFLETFWHSKRLDSIYESTSKKGISPLSNVFRAAYVELSKVKKVQGAEGEEGAGAMDASLSGLENVSRAMRRAHLSELTRLEGLVPFLATIGSTAPFVGLFGTVWGIMVAFQEIGKMGSANLAVVAPGISEALIATAAGLAAAIPAVIAYNYFVSKIKVLDSEMENFTSDFLNIVKRHFM
jgi:biopolymer transport protein TolQ